MTGDYTLVSQERNSTAHWHSSPAEQERVGMVAIRNKEKKTTSVSVLIRCRGGEGGVSSTLDLQRRGISPTRKRDAAL